MLAPRHRGIFVCHFSAIYPAPGSAPGMQQTLSGWANESLGWVKQKGWGGAKKQTLNYREFKSTSTTFFVVWDSGPEVPRSLHLFLGGPIAFGQSKTSGSCLALCKFSLLSSWPSSVRSKIPDHRVTSASQQHLIQIKVLLPQTFQRSPNTNPNVITSLSQPPVTKTPRGSPGGCSLL